MVRTKTFEVPNPEAFPSTAYHLWELGAGCRIWLWKGSLGAGKTTLIRALFQHLNIRVKVQSPTYGLIHKYPPEETGLSKAIQHADLYRIRNEEEAWETGILDLLFEENYVWIEWPECIEHLVPKPYIQIKIEVSENQSRTLEWTLYDE